MNLRQLVENTEFEHSKNVARISELLALRAGYAESEAAVIAQAALCHDVGKTGIPAYILNKPGSLTREEFEIVKTHTDIGHEQIMTVAEVLSAAARTAREHHERPDGNGYLRLSEREIHPYVKLVAIADVFDALYSKRAYKEAWGLSDISAYFQAQAGKQFDRSLVLLFFSILSEVLQLYANPKAAERKTV